MVLKWQSTPGALLLFASCSNDAQLSGSNKAETTEHAAEAHGSAGKAADGDDPGPTKAKPPVQTGDSESTPPDSSSQNPPAKEPAPMEDDTKSVEGLVLEEPDPEEQGPQFGLLVNDLTCGLCHVKIHGDTVSTVNVSPLWQLSKAHVKGQWFALDGFRGDEGVAEVTIEPRPGDDNQLTEPDVSGNGNFLPKDLDGDGRRDFPALDFSLLGKKMQGSIKQGNKDIQKVVSNNVILIGTMAEPIQFDGGEVLVEGDLVIKGAYTGVGNIYVTGNIYIPADLRAQKSVFSITLPATVEATEKHLNSLVDAQFDGLGLAAGGSIIVGNFEGQGNAGVFTHEHTPDDSRYEEFSDRLVPDVPISHINIRPSRSHLLTHY